MRTHFARRNHSDLKKFLINQETRKNPIKSENSLIIFPIKNKFDKMVDNKISFYEEIKIINPFSGDIRELERFLASCFNAKSNLGLPEEPEDEEQERAVKRFMKSISSKLDVDTFRRISLSNPTNMSDFKRCLYEIYHIIKDAAQIYRELTTAKQQEDETIVNYFDRIEDLKQSYEIACEYNDVSIEEKGVMLSQLDRQMQKSCIDGLRSNIRAYCKSLLIL